MIYFINIYHAETLYDDNMGVPRVRMQHPSFHGGGHDSGEIHCVLCYASRIRVSKKLKYNICFVMYCKTSSLNRKK